MSGLYLASGALIGAGTVGACFSDGRWGVAIAFGAVGSLIGALCQHYKDINK